MTAQAIDPIIKTIVVRRTTADAFRIFFADITQWWPLATHTMAKSALGETTVEVTFGPQIGGRIFERLNTGAEHEWGRVLAFEPARRVVFDFYIARTPDRASEVEVRFEAIGHSSCRVVLIHDRWDRLGEDAATARGHFEAGWIKVFVEGFGSYTECV
jgi:hypothetical protein